MLHAQHSSCAHARARSIQALWKGVPGTGSPSHNADMPLDTFIYTGCSAEASNRAVRLSGLSYPPHVDVLHCQIKSWFRVVWHPTFPSDHCFCIGCSAIEGLLAGRSVFASYFAFCTMR